jgi:hypothetical protein
MVSPLALLAAVPMLAAPLYLRDRVVERVDLVANESPAPKPRPSRLPMVAAAATLLLTLGIAVAWDRVAEVPGAPLAAENALPGSTTSAAPTTTETPSATTTPGPTTSTGTRTTTPPPRTTTTTTTTTTPPPPRDTTAPRVVRQSAADPAISVAPCKNTTQITASVTDDVGVTSATLTWTDPSGVAGSKPMAFGNGVWTATLGPFSKTGTARWLVTAADAAGNTGSGAANSILVDVCIG